ncbi:glycine--tRNA ligase subunit alpha [Candidatus Deianiraea vastatrix]|uniref:Glycine--tRNA ligase alpha subunit n=1 Tax=Candidatus Deianiraea vastatrix TaxID=2163644 RepID=A0A5B8XE57_9RICK|nr:glycine--tRNA ligase subunit alpha [Candidatus Deianiraea vastatrix]QED23520.1 Glycine--tRNA ligase alpha subunit [Candidatus Deianiraea vastatrix]
MLTFEEIIDTLEKYWQAQGCTILQSCDVEAGAATLNQMTSMRVLDSKPWNICQTQFCRRPKDARFAQNPNRLGGYYQFQVIMKPVPQNIQELCIESLAQLGIDKNLHDFRFVEDNWENPSIGATGMGYEVWCDNMEITQFTYMQQLGGLPCKTVPVELTYGLERVAMYVQNVQSVFDIKWSKNGSKYSDIHTKDIECEYSDYYQNYQMDKEFLTKNFEELLMHGQNLLENNCIIPGYEYCLKASHILNILDARGYLSQNDRANKLLQVRKAVKIACEKWMEKYGDK